MATPWRRVRVHQRSIRPSVPTLPSLHPSAPSLRPHHHMGIALAWIYYTRVAAAHTHV
jgi:hypothetical protein